MDHDELEATARGVTKSYLFVCELPVTDSDRTVVMSLHSAEAFTGFQ